MNWIKKILGGTDNKTLIHSLEQIYNDLRDKNHDKDEHWLLANVWLMRYRNRPEAKEKGKKLMRFIAYKDTFSFSMLDTPKSIRGLALFLVYKELGEQEAVDGAEEFAQIMESVQKIEGGDRLMNEYKQKNPFTWDEIQAEKDESVYGLYGFLKAADHLNKNPEEQKRVMKEIENL